ncbi:MAG: phosphoribosylformylglycinamidine cyclo-ligase [Proteobacteria bacterium]|nr:phosphoribosylformylglycinamidine cyclo-ligase [Pseudomonadota bacterium]
MNNQHPYAAAGVDVRKAERLTGEFARLGRETHRKGLVGSIGSFAGLFDLSVLPYKKPLLVSSTDGVGTKLLLAQAHKRLDGIGQDLVAMCVNDILCCGAEPLFFLDYFACGTLDHDQACAVVASISRACQLAGCALIGGETAEMPGLYRHGEFDLAGFCVGAVEGAKLLRNEDVCVDDVVVALASSGPHSNGYSLIRKLLADGVQPPPEVLDDLLTPTTIYNPHLLPLLAEESCGIRALAHITGGGLTGNLARCLPATLAAFIRFDWELPRVFAWLAQAGKLETAVLLDTFNAGVGMTAVVSPDDLDKVISRLQAGGLTAWPIGHIGARTGSSVVYVDTD